MTPVALSRPVRLACYLATDEARRRLRAMPCDTRTERERCHAIARGLEWLVGEAIDGMCADVNADEDRYRAFVADEIAKLAEAA